MVEEVVPLARETAASYLGGCPGLAGGGDPGQFGGLASRIIPLHADCGVVLDFV
jgi:hypothetical protein